MGAIRKPSKLSLGKSMKEIKIGDDIYTASGKYGKVTAIDTKRVVTDKNDLIEKKEAMSEEEIEEELKELTKCLAKMRLPEIPEDKK